MELLIYAAAFFILWWMIWFIVLPAGNVSAHEEGQYVELGHAPSAPLKPRLLRKFILTTVIAIVVMSISLLVLWNSELTWADIPFMPDFRTYD